MKKLVFISTRSPFPLIGGEKNKTMNIIKILSKYYDISYYGLSSQREAEKNKELLSQYCKEIHIFHISHLERIINTLRNFFTGQPLQIGYFQNKKMKSALKVAQGDLYFFNLIRSAGYLDSIPNNAKKILDMSDSISEHYRKAAKTTQSFFWKLVYRVEFHRMKKYEIQNMINFSKVFLFNPKEIDLYQHSELFLLPHGVNESVLSRPLFTGPIDEKRICFVGKMDYRPNIDAVIWFSKEVMPLLDHSYRFFIVGANPTKEVLDLKKDRRVHVTGFVKDPFKYLEESLCVVAPMISGGGIQNKVLESMALGTVNIISDHAAQAFTGLKDIAYVAKNKQEFCDIISNLNSHSTSYNRMRKESKNFIKNNYSWDATEKVLLEKIGE